MRRGGRRPRASARARLDELAGLRLRFGGADSVRKREIVEELDRRRFASADDLLRFHELLVFSRAYPDDAALLAAVEAALERFGRRADRRRFHRALADSGVAGCDLHYEFFHPTAVRLAERFPGRLEVDWPAWEGRDGLEPLLHLLLPYSESAMVDEQSRPPAEWLDRLKGPGEADGAFLARRLAALAGDEWVRETIHDRLSPAMVLRGGAETPARTTAKAPVDRIAFQRAPLDGSRPDLAAFLATAKPRVRTLSPRDARRFIDLARDAMITRSRDLDAFAQADPRDVLLVECADGLAFAVMGQRPERRLVLESVHGALTLKNGVPIGYVLISALFGSAELAYNVFDTWRGAEAARVFAWVAATARRLFGATSFSIDPYQLGGAGNREGLESGAWWFYAKLGFRPRDPEVARLARRERALAKKDRGHRTDLGTLERLSSAHVFLDLDPNGGVELGALSPGAVGERVSKRLARRYGADRERGIEESARIASDLLDVRPGRDWSPGERLWWRRWSPIVLTLPGVARWSRAERRALAAVVRAKGGRHESDYVRRFDAHPKLRRAMLRLATPEED